MAREQSNLGVLCWKQPKWSQGFLWVRSAVPYLPSAALTKITLPLLSVPSSELLNHTAHSTLASHSYLFKIVTPINTDHFEQLLVSHTNKPLVSSICKGLQEGFWPLANFDQATPETWDNSTCKLEGADLVFTLQQHDEEIKLGHLSTAFGADLLPGMYNIPIGVVPKPHSTNSWLITDHSTGKFALNNFITKVDSTIHLDNLQDFGMALHTVVAHNSHAPAWLFKSDVLAAYCHIQYTHCGR